MLTENGQNQPVLTKSSSEKEIKNYFEGILKLTKSGEEYPIDLDEVWHLAYTRKSNAVSSLKRNFLQDIDYQFLPQDQQNSQKEGRPSETYLLSTSCLEYLIAKRVRSVFEVYRKVFHHTVQKQLEQPKDKKRQAPPHVPNDRFGCEAITQKGKGKMLWEEELCVKVTQYENWADLNWSNWVSSKSIKAIKEAVDRMYYVLCGE